MAGYKENFSGNIDYAYSRGVTDLTSRVQSGASQFASAGKGITQFTGQANAARRSLKDLSNSMRDIKSEMENATDPKALRKLTKEFQAAQKAAEKFKKQLIGVPFNAMEAGIGSLTKGLITFNANILKMGFDFLINSIKRVYELQERWTHAIGGFNMKIGGMTKGMAGATKAAVQWSSTIRGLTGGSIEEGIQMFGEFTMAMGRTVKAGDGFSKLGMQVARGFGIGGTATGQLFKVFENIGMSADDSAEAMKTSIKAANAANIPVNMLAEDLAKSTTYMARFGKEGQKTLIQGAAWARKYDIALDQLRQSVEGFDMFDEAARSASKLNTTFGTMINSMDLMMEDDPAKRLEMIRQQMLSQGQTYDKLTPKQRRYFSETLKLSDEQTAALLSASNAGESYADFQAKAEAKQKQELNAKAMMQKMLVKTAQTMFAFGSAFDRVTVAIGKAIRPLLEVFGLAKKGGKDFQGFGSVMKNITDTVVKFFESLAVNKDWNKFMITLADDLKKVGAALKDFVMSGRAAKLVGDISVAMKKFYGWVRDAGLMAMKVLKPLVPVFVLLTKHLDKLAIAWAAMKGFNAFRGAKNAVSDVFGGDGGLFGDANADDGKAKGKGKGRMGRGIMGGIGAAATTIATGGGIGAGIGGAVGSLAGAFIPFIGPLLGPAGAALGGFIETLFGDGKSDLEIAQEQYTAIVKKNSDSLARFGETVKIAEAERITQDNVRERADKALNSLKAGTLKLGDDERAQLIARMGDLKGFGKKTFDAAEALRMLNGETPLTKGMMIALKDASSDYNTKLTNLRDVSQSLYDTQMASQAMETAKGRTRSLDRQVLRNEAELKQLKENKDLAESSAAGAEVKIMALEQSKFGIGTGKKEREKIDKEIKWQKMMIEGRIEATTAVKNKEMSLTKLKTDLEKSKFAMEEKIYLMEMRRMAMGSEDFLKFKEQQTMAGSVLSNEQMFKYFAGTNKEAMSAYGMTDEDQANLMKLGSGGIVTRPTKAIIGESGPEAVIPLSRMRENLAGGSSSGGETMVTQIAEVTLDGQKVGRALVRSSIRGRN